MCCQYYSSMIPPHISYTIIMSMDREISNALYLCRYSIINEFPRSHLIITMIFICEITVIKSNKNN